MGRTTFSPTFSPTLSKDKIFNLGERELIDIVTKETVTINNKTFKSESLRNSGILEVITVGDIARTTNGEEWALKDIGYPLISRIMQMKPNE